MSPNLHLQVILDKDDKWVLSQQWLKIKDHNSIESVTKKQVFQWAGKETPDIAKGKTMDELYVL